MDKQPQIKTNLNTWNRVYHDEERTSRLLEFVKGELRDLYVGARLDFTVDIFNYLKPELDSLIKEERIKPYPTE